LSVYLDASIPVSLFTIDTLTARADAVLRARPPLLMVSNLAAAEFASATTRRVRMQLITAQEAHAAFSTFDARIARTTTPLLIASAHSPLRAGFLRRLNLTLRTDDALHIAIAQRVGAELLTFDRPMANAARALGTSVVDLH
jgi:predicted nucleic acid-binding protein